MPQIELLVKLKIPDTTAITTFHTLERMGFNTLRKLTRQDYYIFDVNESFDKFSKKIGKVDVLVNANKHSYIIQLINKKNNNENINTLNILVQSIENDCKNLLHTLKKRLGFTQIKKMEKGVLWTLEFSHENVKEKAENIAKELLVNENYQKFSIL